MNTYLLIDGNAVMHRAYHAIPPFKTKTGTPTNVIYGFYSILHKVLIDFKPNHLIVCFDIKGPTFRRKLFKDYKATRKIPDADLLIQIPFVKEGLKESDITYIEKQGYEADDIIGTICERLKKKDCKVLVLSGDKDILQLATGNTFVITPPIGFSKMIIYNETEVLNRYGVTPKQMVDYKALAGDQSDNYSGAKGIGPKTATQLINQFGDVETLLKKRGEIKSEKVRQIVEKNKENILMGKKLAMIDKNVEFDLDFEKTKFSSFSEKLKTYLLKYEMYSLANRFFKQKVESKKVELKKRGETENQARLF